MIKIAQMLDTALPRVLPKQRRSRARREAMIKLGERLLNQRDLGEISIAELTRELGCSTGSFYTCFADKTAFFIEVQHHVSTGLDARIDAEFDANRLMGMSVAERLVLCVNFTLAYFRKHSGLIRCALRYEQRIPEAWAPNRASAQKIADAVVIGLEPHIVRQMRVAVQLAFGVMVNAVLHDPGPLRLQNPVFAAEIINALTPYLNEAVHKPAQFNP